MMPASAGRQPLAERAGEGQYRQQQASGQRGPAAAPARMAVVVPPHAGRAGHAPVRPTTIWPMLWASSSRRALWRRPVAVSASIEVNRVLSDDSTARAKAAMQDQRPG